ncbi:hypothetical protein GGR53DRAFT_149104 [Hypoxylon sp. FL1150]|nr:hypothetical protein GGR53DRAFT_149104 [Hypoxylon sp. FL1150]
MEPYFKAFSGLVTAALVWSMWGGNVFPPDADPKGDPQEWTREELRRWLAAVRILDNLSRPHNFNMVG